MRPRKVTPEPDRRSSSRKSGQLSNVVPIDFARTARILNDPDMLVAYDWSPLVDEDQETAEEALDLIHDWIWLAYGAVAALSFILIVLWARG